MFNITTAHHVQQHATTSSIWASMSSVCWVIWRRLSLNNSTYYHIQIYEASVPTVSFCLNCSLIAIIFRQSRFSRSPKTESLKIIRTGLSHVGCLPYYPLDLIFSGSIDTWWKGSHILYAGFLQTKLWIPALTKMACFRSSRETWRRQGFTSHSTQNRSLYTYLTVYLNITLLFKHNSISAENWSGNSLSSRRQQQTM